MLCLEVLSPGSGVGWRPGGVCISGGAEKEKQATFRGIWGLPGGWRATQPAPTIPASGSHAGKHLQ